MNYTLKNKNGHTVVDIWLNVKYRFVKVSLYVSKEVRLGCNIAINLNFGMNSKSLHFNAISEGIWQKCVFHRMSDMFAPTLFSNIGENQTIKLQQ